MNGGHGGDRRKHDSSGVARIGEAGGAHMRQRSVSEFVKGSADGGDVRKTECGVRSSPSKPSRCKLKIRLIRWA